MSRRSAQGLFARGPLFADVPRARARPYPERAESDPAWHDRLATQLLAHTLAPLRARFDALTRGRHALRRIAQATDRAEQPLRGLSDEALRASAQALRLRLRRDALALDDVAASFAHIRQAAERVMGQRHFDTQLAGAQALLQGRLAEMATGEGKTFCATLAACTMGLAGYPVHVITVNDYLAARDAKKMAPLYAFFGLRVGVVEQGMEKPARRAAYACDITYGTNKEVAFDYLRDQTALPECSSALHLALQRLSGHAVGQDLVLRGLVYAIVDEADSVFVDEARTPLILSAAAQGSDDATECLQWLDFARGLQRDLHFGLRVAERQLHLLEAGRAALEAHAQGRGGVWTSVRAREERVLQALSALHLFLRDQHYVVANEKVQIVDESTGRVMPDRSWERGLHQLIEAKEGVALTAQRQTLARLTYQSLFRRYLHVSGMTGTASEAAAEIHAVYGLPLAHIPLHRPSLRVHLPVRLCLSLEDKWALVGDVAQQVAQRAGRAVLIGTRSVQASEQISAVLQARGVAHALLNAKQDADEAAVVAQAGQAGRVTVATNMAGRGTDIALDADVLARGGLHVVLTEYHDSRRVDRQLFGRCARQGDPGSCEAIVSLQDELFVTAVPWLAALLAQALGRGVRVPPVAVGMVRALAQWLAQRRQAQGRMQHLKYDRQLNQMLAFTGRGE